MNKQTKPLTLTASELGVLRCAFASAAGNGHDFGLVEDIVRQLRPCKAQRVGALVASLVKKGIITVHEPMTTDSGRWTQFTWNSSDFENQVTALLMV